MPIADRTLKGAKVINTEGRPVDLFLLRWPPRGADPTWYLAVPVKKCTDGIILALPGGALPEEVLTEGQTSVEGTIGPSTLGETTIQDVTDAEMMVQVLLVEFSWDVRNMLETKTPRTRRVFTGFGDDPACLPSFAEIEDLAATWISGGILRSDGYITAEAEEVEEDAQPRRVSDQLAQLQVMLETRFSQLEQSVTDLQSHPQLQAVPPPTAWSTKPPGLSAGASPRGVGEMSASEVLTQGRSQVKAAPARIPDEPLRARDTAAQVRQMPLPEDETSLDQMMKMSLLQLMKELQDKGDKPRRKAKLGRGIFKRRRSQLEFHVQGRPGYRSSGTAPGSNEEQARALSKPHGSKDAEGHRNGKFGQHHTREVHENSPSRQNRMEAKMLKATEMASLDSTTPGKFMKTVPVGKSRTAGYCLQGFCEIHRLMIDGKDAQARLHTLRMISALEQFLIDENWMVAARLTGTEEPPWGEWACQDLGALRRQYVFSRLAEPTWVGAHINQLKEEEWLTKKRQGLPKAKAGNWQQNKASSSERQAADA